MKTGCMFTQEGIFNKSARLCVCNKNNLSFENKKGKISIFLFVEKGFFLRTSIIIEINTLLQSTGTTHPTTVAKQDKTHS